MRYLSSCRRWFEKLSRSRRSLSLGAVFLFILAIGLSGPIHFASAQIDPIAYSQAFTKVIILFITQVLQGLTAVIGQLALSLIEMIIVPILQYNAFSTSPTVGLGWKLVRDVVNMFVVLVLLIIAIATIVGYEKVSWQKNLPQFLLAVVMVNFSRTICGFLIDISQVVMFTFVNALLDVAAGNFATMFDMQSFGNYAPSALWDKATGEAKPIEELAQLGAAYLQFILYACICAVLLLLALVYIWRIVVLWVLVIMSPLTFFTWGLGGMFKFAAGVSADWWKKFTAAVTLGPMLTFFLWLALSTGTGNIVASEHFMPVDSAVDNTLESLETTSLLSTFLGLILLIIGMQQSAATANSLGGVAKKYMGDEKTGQKLVGGAIKLPFQAAGRGAGYLDRQAGRAWNGEGRLSGTAVKNSLEKTGDFARNYVPGATKGVVGRTFANIGGAAQARIEHLDHAEKKAAQDRVSKYTEGSAAEHIRLVNAGQGAPIGLDAAANIEALKVRMLTDSDFRKTQEKLLGKAEYNKFMSESVLTMSDAQIKHAGGDLDKANKGRSQNVHLNNKVWRNGKLVEDNKKMDEFIQSNDFDPSKMSKDAVASTAVLKSLEDKVLRVNADGSKLTAHNELMKGKYGKERMDIAKGASVPSVYDATQVGGDPKKAGLLVANPATASPYTTKDLVGNIDAGRIQVASLSVAEFKGANGDNLVKALLQNGVAPAAITDTAARTEYESRASTFADTPGAVTPRQAAVIDEVRLNASGAVPTDVFDPAGTGVMDQQRVIGVLKRNAMAAGQFRGVVSSGTPYEAPAQDAIVDAITGAQVEDMEKNFRNTSDANEAKKIADAMEAISRSIQGHIERMGLAARGQRVKDVDEGLDGVYKRVRRAARAMSSAGVTPPPANL